MYGERDNGGGNFEGRRETLQAILMQAGARVLEARPNGYTIELPHSCVAVATNSEGRQPIDRVEHAVTADEKPLVSAARALMEFEHIAAAQVPISNGFKLYIGDRKNVEGLMQPHDWIPYTGDD